MRTLQQPLRMRLLHPPSVQPRDVEAAFRAAREFERFGIQVDRADVENKASVKGVIRGRLVREILLANGLRAIHPYDLAHSTIRSVFFPEDIMPVGITSFPLVKLDDEGKLQGGAVGISLFGRGSLLSVDRMAKLEADLRERAIGMAVLHEVGHLLIPKEGPERHCKNTACRMQGNRNFQDFLDRFVQAALKFCVQCEIDIRYTVAAAMRG